MFQLVIKYNKYLEKERVRYTTSKLKWYKEQGYKPILPKCDEELERFEAKLYKDAEEIIKAHDFREFFNKAEEKLGKEIPKKIIIILTKYGVIGSYSMPNKVTINIHSKKPLIEVIKHEIIPLLVEHEVLEKRLTHHQKEMMVKDIEKSV